VLLIIVGFETMTRVVDCTVFFNENDLFRLRFEELKSCVTDFIVVEATRTHAGARKGIFFDDHWLASAEQKDKVLHFIVDDLPGAERDSVANRWLPEQFQRNSIIRPLMELGLSDDDIVLISDVDEIPSDTSVQEAIELLDKFDIVIFEQKLKKYFLNNGSQVGSNNAPWLGTVACKFGWMRLILPQGARLGDPLRPRSGCLAWGYARPLYPYEARVSNAGWHLSSMGGMEAVTVKHRSIAEAITAGTREPIHRSPLGAHNFRAFRQNNQDAIASFMEQYCPILLPVTPKDAGGLDRLGIPDAIKKDVMSYQSLFYFTDPLD
jgi:hypothetical protein